MQIGLSKAVCVRLSAVETDSGSETRIINHLRRTIRMSKVAVVYYSGSGNTEAMADVIVNATARVSNLRFENPRSGLMARLTCPN